MLPGYQVLFTGIPYVTLALALIVLSSVLFFKSWFVARSILFAYGFWLAPLFYLSYLTMVQQVTPAIILALFVELVFLGLYLASFPSLLSAVRAGQPIDLGRLRRWMKISVFLKLALVGPLTFQSGFGLFSTGSRLEYLSGSRLNEYLTYASVLLDAVAIPIIAAILNRQKRWDALVVCYLLITAVFSLLAGSKGGTLLEFLAILSLLQFESARGYIKILRVPLIAMVSIAGATIYYLGSALSLKPEGMLSLMFSRIFITNDARALAIDYSGFLNQDATSLFQESFRSLSSLFGTGSPNLPLGQLLYENAFGTAGLVGANSSSTALLVAYGNDAERVMFALMLCFVAAGLCLAIRSTNRYSILTASAGLFLLSLLTQDFLAFQILVNLVLLVAVCLIVAIFLKRVVLMGTQDQGTT